jgi:hypothetical protein
LAERLICIIVIDQTVCCHVHKQQLTFDDLLHDLLFKAHHGIKLLPAAAAAAAQPPPPA